MHTVGITHFTQAWAFPTTASRIGAIQTLSPELGPNKVLAVANSTLYGAVHGKDTMSLLDSVRAVYYAKYYKISSYILFNPFFFVFGLFSPF